MGGGRPIKKIRESIISPFGSDGERGKLKRGGVNLNWPFFSWGEPVTVAKERPQLTEGAFVLGCSRAFLFLLLFICRHRPPQFATKKES